MAVAGQGLAEAFARLAPMLAIAVPVQSDVQLVGFADAVEQVARCVEALQLRVAAEFDARSDETLGEESFARRLGGRKAAGALETVTRTSASDAARRVREARSLARLPVFADAVACGVIGRVQAAEITAPLFAPATVADPALVAAACENLIELAEAVPASAVVEAARAWAAVLDPDGIEPVEQAAIEKRFVHLGRAKNGLVRLTSLLPVEQAAAIRTVIDAYLNPRAGACVTFTPGEDTGDAADRLPTEDAAPPRDPRTRGQQTADILHAVFTAHARSGDAPTLGGTHPMILVTVTKDELENGRGAAWIDGEDDPISAKTAARIAESGGAQQIEVSPDGQILTLGRTQRCFTPAQRRALAARDHGCIIPGCTAPARWCETHHLTDWQHGGTTDITNGVLLCWWHHHDIDTGPYEIRMTDNGTPQIRWVFGSHASPWVTATHTPRHQRTHTA